MKRFPPSQGLKWVKGSFSLLKTQTYRLVLIGLILQFLTGFSQAGTFGLLFVMAIPALSAGVLQAMYMVSNGLVPPVMVLFVAFQSSARLLRLFVLSLVLMAAGLLAASSVMSGSIDAIGPDILGALERGDVAALQAADPEVLQMLAASALTGLAVSGLLAYFTIPLVWFSGYTLGRAIGVGLKALLRNILPFLVQVTALFVLAIPLQHLLLGLVFDDVHPHDMIAITEVDSLHPA